MSRSQLIPSPPPLLPDELESWMSTYRPVLAGDEWKAIRPVFVDVIRSSKFRKLSTVQRRGRLLVSFLTWCHHRGVAMNPIAAMTHNLVDEYVSEHGDGSKNWVEISNRLRWMAESSGAFSFAPSVPSIPFKPLSERYTPLEEAQIRKAVSLLPETRPTRKDTMPSRQSVALIVALAVATALSLGDLGVAAFFSSGESNF